MATLFSDKPFEKGLVSVVLPIFNPNVEYLKEALSSIQRQYYSNIEVVISDDTNIDEAKWKEVISIFEKGVRLIIVKNEDERGIFSNLNNAIWNSSGEYIQIFCQDDIMKEDFIEHQIAGFKVNRDVALVFSNYDVIDEVGRVISASENYTFSEGKKVLIESKDSGYYFLRFGCLPGNLSPVMLKREVFLDVGWFDQKYPYAGDFNFWVRVARKNSILYRPERGLYVRKHKDQASFTISEQFLLSDLQRIYNELIMTLPARSRKQYVNQLNKRVGASFIHHMFRRSIFIHRSYAEIKSYLKELNRYPFNIGRSLIYYILTVPRRLYGAFRLLKWN